MSSIYAYFTFNGNCRQALSFYKACLGGILDLQTIGDSPMSDQLPDYMHDFVLHGSLTSNSLVIAGTDMVSEAGLTKGNSISLLLNCSTAAEARIYYRKLSENGIVTSPLRANHWGALFGTLTDQFGHHWLISYEGSMR
ncbi:VOC family protein [Chitinophaga silvatica]|uniref:VOC family protein n=1 Tax=Chitinophaga silvatica TaxID=2282649 RepID=A0A3E1Y960_9BACT|nr:VOC family protein [Chitinophaga silvatica]RFS21942.1 VOC family protein [Chitinophaga silvatica]